ncbi:ATP-binding protein [Isachenkonia alkalipeptolytica]|uniref:histidine kinase n=1 Tax=Isachenkonia alkalipeptolytica TaxID=2565777 RepID=A0AA44BEG4_9CLOT|nr:ATP-binding protein [Isachenkonia alkalipeptolytica]
MKELSLHILDIVQNSLKANATLIKIKIVEDFIKDRLTIDIKDNGKGMSSDLLKSVTDPFVTTRDTRRVGLGISLLKATAEQCEGSLRVESEEGKGTGIHATFQHSHIDRAPLGSMEDTLTTLLITSEEQMEGGENTSTVDYVYEHQVNDESFVFDTREVKKILEGTPINDLEILDWIKGYLKENLETLVKS